MSQSAYAKIENGHTTLDINRLLRISELLDLEITDLLSKSEGQNLQFNGNDGYQNVQVEHFHADGRKLLQQKDQHINHLEQEIEFLRTQLKK